MKKIVIEISDTLMEYIVKGRDLSEEQNNEMACAIADGTPLPKHHGRLIDADELMKEVVFISNEDESYSFVYAENIADAPTIIEEGDSE